MLGWRALMNSRSVYFWTFCLVAAILFYARDIIAQFLTPYNNLTDIGIDFVLFLDASDNMLTINPYELKEIWTIELGYLYSPLFLIIMQPLTWISAASAFLIWRVIILICLIRTFILCLRIMSVPLQGGRPYFLLVIAIALLQRPLAFALQNITPILLWMAIESYVLITTKRHWRAGALLALGINIKLILLPVLVYWVWRGYGRVLWIVLLFSLLYLVLPALVFSWNANLALLSNWYSVLATQDHVLMQGSYASGVLGLLAYLTPLPAIPQFLTYAFVGFLILWTLYYLGRITPFPQATRPSSLTELSYILLIIPFIYPHQNFYSLVLAMPCLIWITNQLIQTRRSIPIGLACCAYLLLLFSTIPFSLFFGYGWQSTYPVPDGWIKLLYLAGLLLLIPLLTHLKSREDIADGDLHQQRDKLGK